MQDLRVVREDGPLQVALCRLYLDGADVSGKAKASSTTVYVFSWTPIGQTKTMQARRICTVFDKRRACRCGCSGACTINAIWHRLSWSWCAWRDGYHPTRGPLNETLTGTWANIAGQKIKGRGQAAHTGADWEALADSFGQRRWNHLLCPCPWCDCNLGGMHNYNMQHKLLTRADYDSEMEKSEVIATLDSPGLADALQEALQPDLKINGSHGRALKYGVGHLKAGLRLEASREVPDNFVDIRTLTIGTRLHFYKPDNSNRLRFWCALFYCYHFGSEAALEPDAQVGDLLHTVDGGASQYLSGAIFDLFIKHAVQIFNIAGGRVEVVRKRAVVELRSCIQKWARTPEGKKYGDVYVELHNLIGGGAEPCVVAKAMDSRALFFFARHILSQHIRIFLMLPDDVDDVAAKANTLLASAGALAQWYEIIFKYGYQIPRHECAQAVRLAKKSVNLYCTATGYNAKPKHHALVDMSRLLWRTGNPKMFSTYMDESFNGLIGNLARSVHPSTLAIRVLRKYKLLRDLLELPY